MPLTPIVIGTADNTDAGTDSLFDTGTKVNNNESYLDGKIDTEETARIAADLLKVNIAGGQTMTAPLKGPDPVADVDYANKQWVISQLGTSTGDYLPLTGGDVTGNVRMYGATTNYPILYFTHTDVNYGGMSYTDQGEFIVGSQNGADFSLMSNNTVRVTIDSLNGDVAIANDAGVGGDFAVVGTSRFGDTTLVTEDVGVSEYVSHMEVGLHTVGDRTSVLDLHGDDTYTDYGFRINRDGNNGGLNCNTEMFHRGTGELRIQASEALGTINFYQNGSEAAKIDTDRSLTNVALKNYREKVVTHNAVSGVIELDLEEGNTHVLNITGNTQWHVSNITGGAYGTGLTIIANFSGDYTLQNCSTTYWTGGAAPAFTASGTDIITAIYIDTKWYCSAITDVQSVAGTESCF